MRLGTKKGFTLVELLVVIGIIALLISILLPSLNKARSSASLLACQSNFRQVNNALLFYAGDNKGFLPFASRGNWGPQGVNSALYIDLSRRLGRTLPNENGMPLSPVFTCTDAADANNGSAWAPHLARTIKFHPRAMPGHDQLNGTTWPQRRISSVKRSAEKALAWDGPQLPAWNMTTEPGAIYTDNWRWNTGTPETPGGNHMFSEEIHDAGVAQGQQDRRNVAIHDGTNRDDGWWICSIRYRHMNNKMTPVLYFDGHVESKTRTAARPRDSRSDFLVKEILINLAR